MSDDNLLSKKVYLNDSLYDLWRDYYNPFYSNMGWDFWNIFEYPKSEPPKEGRLYAKCYKESEKYGRFFIESKLGGEKDFNFNPIKYKQYEKIINNNKKINKTDVYKLLEECKERQNRRCNFSLLITTGGLNSLKGRLSQEQGKRSLDRFDVYTFVLNDYFQIRKVREDYMHIIFSEAWHSAKENREILCEYLKLYGGIEDYFKKNYNINDRKLIRDLIESGSKPLDSSERVVEYLDLAARYWNAKEDGIREVLSKFK